MSKLYVFSTLASDVTYTNHAPGGADLPKVVAEVKIKGGAGVANDRFVTPRGVVTTITEDEAEALRANPVFQLHEANGFVQISDKSGDADEVAADMTGRDNSAPLVSQDLPADQQPANGEQLGDPAADAQPAKKRK